MAVEVLVLSGISAVPAAALLAFARILVSVRLAKAVERE